jgi:DNA polymerase
VAQIPSEIRDVLVYLEGIGYGELYLPEGGGAGPAAGAPAPAPTPEPGRTAPPAPRAAAAEAPPSAEERAAALAAVAREAEVCERCKLCRGRTTVVFGTGDPDADLMFIGEGPGAEEDRQGLPFVGPAGQLLDKIIQAIGLERPQVYIANIVKCRPPGNRDPQPDEAAACRPFLERQIELVRPKVIVALGRVAAQALLGNDLPLGRMRGRWFTVQGVPTMVTYHPAALLRNRHWKRPTWEDMQAVRDRLHAG